MFSYLPGPLLAQTRAFFETEALLPSQLQARDNFIFLFRLHQDDTYTDLTTLEQFMVCLDEFFFAGQLTRGGITQRLEYEPDIFASAPPEGYGRKGRLSHGDVHTSTPLGESRLAPRVSDGRWVVTISIDPNDQVDGLPCPLHNLLETLVHELVHSFLHSFLCYCGPCRVEKTCAGVLGPTGHGRLFVELLHSIARVVRGWDKDLAALYVLDDFSDA
ncbi:hypothetical protein N8I77_012832 [Diaporthe amygdali]|uniref:SprT-like domain-containing protein n=1 Tax=Phomopsis amygdali TaxID=1214568 RepID=A0AAD9S1P8_PHOAM|nr:hypothetical protein N8I77_012832 [Diaporthe amygdali]